MEPCKDKDQDGDNDVAEAAEEEREEREDLNDEEVDPLDFYNRFKHYEDEMGLGDMPDDYFDDATAPIDHSRTKKRYVFSHKDESHHQDYYKGNDYYQDYGSDPSRPYQQVNTKKPQKSNQANTQKPGLISVPKTKFTKEEKKKMDKLLKDMQNKNPKEIVGQMKQLDGIAFDKVTKSQAKQIQREQLVGGKNKDQKKDKDKKEIVNNEPKHEMNRKERKKQIRGEKRAHLQANYNEQIKSGHKDDECEEPPKNQDPPKLGLTERAKKKGKHNKISDEEARMNSILYGNKDGSIVEYSGLEKTIIQNLSKVEHKEAEMTNQEPDFNMEDQIISEFITLHDLGRPDYYFEYISETGEQFDEAMDYLATQPVVGFDTEFVNHNEKGMVATYLQISTLQKGFVINLQNSQFETNFRSKIMAFCASPKVKKIGFSIGNDFKALSMTFNNELEFVGFEDLNMLLFTTHSKNNSTGIGLSDQCLRFYEKPLDKEAQKTIAYQKELVDEKEMRYAAMDALIPISLYTDMKKWIDLTPSDSYKFSRKFEPKDVEFLLDPSCRGLKDLLGRSEFGYKLMEKKTYKEISKICKESEAILVTADKYQIGSDDFPNVVVFYDTATFKEDFYDLTCMELA